MNHSFHICQQNHVFCFLNKHLNKTTAFFVFFTSFSQQVQTFPDVKFVHMKDKQTSAFILNSASSFALKMPEVMSCNI